MTQSSTLPGPTAPAPRRLKRPIRRTTTTVLGFFALGCAAVVVVLAGVVGLYILRDAYQAGHQPTPRDAANAYLDAMLNKNSLSLAENYMCGSAALEKQTRDIIRQPTEFMAKYPGATMTYSWSGFKVRHKTPKSAVLQSRVSSVATVGGHIVTSPTATWTLRLKDSHGWKVCALDTGD